jgi:hypothetical protein
MRVPSTSMRMAAPHPSSPRARSRRRTRSRWWPPPAGLPRMTRERCSFHTVKRRLPPGSLPFHMVKRRLPAGSLRRSFSSSRPATRSSRSTRSSPASTRRGWRTAPAARGCEGRVRALVPEREGSGCHQARPPGRPRPARQAARARREAAEVAAPVAHEPHPRPREARGPAACRRQALRVDPAVGRALRLPAHASIRRRTRGNDRRTCDQSSDGPEPGRLGPTRPASSFPPARP